MRCDVLIIHEKAEVRDLLAGIAAAGGCNCRTAADCDAAMREIASERPSLVLLGGSLDGVPNESLATLERLIADHCPTPVIAIGRPRTDDLGRQVMTRMIKNAVSDAQWQNQAKQAETRAA
jgi:DNA-binding NtrC family response regulator